MRRLPLFKKVFIGLLVVFAVVGTTIGLASAWLLDRSLEDEFLSKGTAVANSISTSAIELLQSRDVATLQSTIDQFLAIDGVAYVMVVDDAKVIVSHTFVPAVPEIIRQNALREGAARDGRVHSERLEVPGAGSFIDVSSPILAGVIGRVHVGLDRSLITAKIRRAILIQQAIVFTVFALSVALAYAVVKRTAKPLSVLTAHVGLIAREGVGQATTDPAVTEVAKHSQDEVGDLTRAFLDMSATIAHQVGELEQAKEHLSEYNRTLEQRVAERTAEVVEKNRSLEQTLTQLKQAQEQIITQEKLASLGALTAGIAHEIKNPLNFVMNFAQVSSELAAELRELMEKAPSEADDEARWEAREIIEMIQTNLVKINEHGGRADSIVRNMLRHSRGQKGERGDVDLNALVHEYVGLAYHGMRGQDQTFNTKIEERLDPAVGKVSVVPQELSRALLNMLTNACYALRDKQRATANGYKPMLTVVTTDQGHQVEVRIRDNGNGIPDSVRAKIFTPFFTTKPTGEGTGLGLSMTYDIIVKVHRGLVRFESEPGQFTEFIVTLPRRPDGAVVSTN
jgi:signal transduction histidine kinase